MRRGPLWILAVLITAASCAISEAPPGGPEDKTPPKVTETFPANGAVGVPIDSEIGVEFSEGMKRARLERLVSLSPPEIIAKAKWKKDTVWLSFEQPLHPDTTYILELKRGFSDSHGVKSEAPYRFAFATSAHIDSGVVTGRVFFRREPTSKGVVRLFVLPRDSSFTPEAGRPDREVRTAEDGSYEFSYLPTNGRKFLIWAFQDQNGNMRFDREEEYGAELPDTISLSGGVPRLDEQDITIVDLKEPAVVSGKVLNNTGVDSMLISVTLNSVTDSVPPTYYVKCDTLGRYKFEKVLRGSYLLYAFMDFSGDSLCGSYPCPGDTSAVCSEPCAEYPDTVRVEPGAKIELEDLPLGGATPPGE
ncbi:MAG: Ig-like domain-containing protein [bacterium]